MTRAYIRLDPAFDERKESYPDGPFSALVSTFCLAEHQPHRGRFRSLEYLARLLGKRGRHARFLLEHGDLILLDDGRVYVDGWDEWQEGDWKVSERVGRIRGRQRRTAPVTPDVTVDVTPTVTPGVTVDRLAVSAGGSEAVSEAGAQQSAPDPWEAPETEVLQWLAHHGCDIRPGNGYHQKLITAVERHGVNAMVGMLDRLAAAGTKQGDTKGFLFGAIDALDSQSRPDLGTLAKMERAGDVAEDFRRRVERTKRMAHENGTHVQPNPGCPLCGQVGVSA